MLRVSLHSQWRFQLEPIAHDPAQAEKLLAELERLAPSHADTAGFKAAVQMKRREYGNARDTLTKLRARSACSAAHSASRLPGARITVSNPRRTPAARSAGA